VAIVSLAQFTAYTRNNLSPVDDVLTQIALDGAEFSVLDYVQRNVALASGSSARLYVPTESEYLWIHDCTAVSAISDNGTALVVGTDYQLEPVNNLDATGATVPFSRVRRLSGCWESVIDGKATISVTATWGWAAIPAWATQAVLLLGKDIVDARSQQGGVASFGEFGAVRVRQHPVVARLLDPHRSAMAWGIA
jgi:hypothetical protein